MNTPEKPSLSTAHTDALPPFARAVLRAVTLQKIAVAQALGLLLGLLNYAGERGGDPSPHLLYTLLIGTSVGALFVTVAAVATDEAIRRGVQLRRAFPLALAAAGGGAAIAQWWLRSWLGVVDYTRESGPPLANIVEVAFEVCVYGGLAMMIYLQRQDAQRMLAGIRATELQRVEDEQRLIESHVTTARAQIDPRAVLRQLVAIRDHYAAAMPEAETGLEALIQELRASVVPNANTSPTRQPLP